MLPGAGLFVLELSAEISKNLQLQTKFRNIKKGIHTKLYSKEEHPEYKEEQQ